MANSYAFVLSKNTYPDAWQANFLGVNQGTMIVYASTNTLSSSTVLFTDSRLTQPIYGNPDAWLGAQLLTDDAVKYAVTISDAGVIDPVSNPTTTTSAPTTTTTTSAVTTYTELYSISAFYSCTAPVTESLTFYSASSTLTAGASVFENYALTTPLTLGYVILLTSGTRFFVGDGGVLSIYNCPGGSSSTTTAAPATTTTTVLFSGVVSWSDTNACTDSAGLFAITGNGTTFCNSTSLEGTGFASLSIGSHYLAYGGQTYTVATGGSPYATVTSACSSC